MNRTRGERRRMQAGAGGHGAHPDPAQAGPAGAMPAHAGRALRVLMLVENLPSPFDRRVWQEACALRDAGYVVSIICPTGRGYDRKFEVLEDIHIHRYRLPLEAEGAAGYAAEY